MAITVKDGKYYVKKGSTIVSGPFNTAGEANAASKGSSSTSTKSTTSTKSSGSSSGGASDALKNLSISSAQQPGGLAKQYEGGAGDIGQNRPGYVADRPAITQQDINAGALQPGGAYDYGGSSALQNLSIGLAQQPGGLGQQYQAPMNVEEQQMGQADQINAAYQQQLQANQRASVGQAPTVDGAQGPFATGEGQLGGYVQIDGAYFEQTPFGLAAVADPNILRGLRSGEIQTSSQAPSLQAGMSIFPGVVTPDGLVEGTPQTQQIYDGITSKYGITSTPQDFYSDPFSTINNLVQQVLGSMGYGEVNSEYEKIADELEDLENKRDDELRDVGDNPWLTEGVRLRQRAKVEEKWADRIDNRTNKLQLLDGVRDDARQQAQFALGTAISLWDSQRQFQQQQLQMQYDQAQRQFDNQIKLQSLAQQDTPSSVQEYLFAKENGYSGSFYDWKNPGKATGGSGGKIPVGGYSTDPTLGGANDEFLSYLKSTAGGRLLTQSEAEPLTNANRVVDQLQGITDTIVSEQTGPILGIVRSNNPYDVKARELQAAITAVVPQLARGVYGEVGVLTDTDVARYVQTLPNIQSTDDVNKAVMGITLRSVRSAFVRQLEGMGAAGRDVSGYVNIYQRLNQSISDIENQLGIGTAPIGTDFASEFANYQALSTSTSTPSTNSGSGFFGSLKGFFFGE